MLRIVAATDGEVGDGAAADDAVVVLPEAAATLQENFGGGVVVQLSDRALLAVGERFEDLDMPQHGERNGDDGVVACGLEAPGVRLVVHADGIRRLIERDHLRAEADVAF